MGKLGKGDVRSWRRRRSTGPGAEVAELQSEPNPVEPPNPHHQSHGKHEEETNTSRRYRNRRVSNTRIHTVPTSCSSSRHIHPASYCIHNREVIPEPSASPATVQTTEPSPRSPRTLSPHGAPGGETRAFRNHNSRRLRG